MIAGLARALTVVMLALPAGAAAQQGVQDRGPAGAARPPINTLADLFAAIERCWVPPPLSVSRPGMQITVLVNFKRNGEVFGKPRITYESPGATEDERIAYRTAIADALQRCSPLPFTDAFGNATAGSPKTIRFIDHRTQKKAETSS